MTIEEIVQILTAAIALASAIAAVTPTPKDNKVVGTLYKLLVELPALNIGKAKD